MRITNLRQAFFTAVGLFSLFLGVPLYAGSEVLGVGHVPYTEALNGPATMVMRRLTIAPGEVLGWHYHPGVGAYTIVRRGTLTVEDGCGGEEVFTAGQAFIEHVNRVHRGKNLGSEEVETLQTFLVPPGSPISIPAPHVCGEPQTVNECKSDGWMTFTFPHTFADQGECMQQVITGK